MFTVLTCRYLGTTHSLICKKEKRDSQLLLTFFFLYFSDHNSDESSIHFGVRVEGIDELMSNTKFSRQELQRMYRGFKNVRTTTIITNNFYLRNLFEVHKHVHVQLYRVWLVRFKAPS